MFSGHRVSLAASLSKPLLCQDGRDTCLLVYYSRGRGDDKSWREQDVLARISRVWPQRKKVDQDVVGMKDRTPSTLSALNS